MSDTELEQVSADETMAAALALEKIAATAQQAADQAALLEDVPEQLHGLTLAHQRLFKVIKDLSLEGKKPPVYRVSLPKFQIVVLPALLLVLGIFLGAFMLPRLASSSGALCGLLGGNYGQEHNISYCALY